MADAANQKIEEGTAAFRFAQLEPFREPYLNEAVACARVTIPHEFPEAYVMSSDRRRVEVYTPNQELGARCVNNLSEKIHLSVLPPNTTLMKYEIDALAKTQASPEELDEAEKLLLARERVITASIDSSRYRPRISPCTRQLVIAGSYLLRHRDRALQGWRLNRWVCKRDAYGEVFEIILKETLDYDTLPDNVKAVVNEQREFRGNPDEREIDVFTWVKVVDGQQRYHQEVLGVKIEGSEGTAPADAPEWIVASMYRLDGEDYGRSHVAMYLGALETYDSLSQSIAEDAEAAAFAIPMVNPDGRTEIEDVIEADNLSPIEGRPEDVGFFRMDKNADFAVAYQQIQRLEASLSFAFLLNSAARRDAERVTAEEIRYIAQELESSLGGFYSTITEEVQLPLVKSHERMLERSKALEPLPDDLVRTVIMTGLESIGRGQDSTNLNLLANDLAIWAQILQSPLGSGFKPMGLVEKLAAARSVDLSDLHMTDEELKAKQAQEEQRAMMMQAADSLGPSAIKAASDQALAGAPPGPTQ